MEKEILYRISKMELSQFATFDDEYNKTSGEIEITSKFTFSYSFDQNIVCCSNTVSFLKNESPLLKAELNVFFAINPMSISELAEGDDILFPQGLQAQFASLTYETLRGVIFTKTLGTALNNIILPPNNILDIIQKPILFKRQ